MLQPAVSMNELQSMKSTGGNDPIIPEVVVACGLHFLGGSVHKDLADIYGMSVDSARRVVNNFLDVVDSSEEFAIKIPKTSAELKKAADEWNELSGAFGIYYGVVGAIDGWLACIEKPSVSNPTNYFSGHYQ